MALSNSEILAIIVIGINVLLAVGGFIGTVLMAVLGWMVKRLIKSVDDLRISNEKIVRSIDQRPDYEEVDGRALKTAENVMVKHERDNKHERNVG